MTKTYFIIAINAKGGDLQEMLFTAWRFYSITGIAISFRYNNKDYVIDESTNMNDLINSILPQEGKETE